jgi:simple sugar transport system permease protein
MSIGAFFTYCFMVKTGSVFISCFLSALICAALGFLTAAFVQVSNANPFITGLALNLAADGLTATLSRLWFGTSGVLRSAGLFANNIGFAQTPFIVAAALCFLLSAFLVYETRFGLRLRASGLSTQAVEERGIHPARYRVAAWTIAAMLAGVGGACLTLRVGAYTPGGVSGRGWIALAAVYLGFRRMWGLALASFVFAAVERAGITLQTIRSLPPTALLGIPSALALAFYAASCAIQEKRGKNVKRGSAVEGKT